MFASSWGRNGTRKSPRKNTEQCTKTIRRADKVYAKRLREESRPDRIAAYKCCQHDSMDEQKEEYLLSDRKEALGRAVAAAAGDAHPPGWR